MKLTELAPAKLNLTLEVGEKRSDGYHEVQSVMSCAALYDEVTLESGTSGGILRLPGPALGRHKSLSPGGKAILQKDRHTLRWSAYRPY